MEDSEPKFTAAQQSASTTDASLHLDAEFDAGDLLLITRTEELVRVIRADGRMTEVERGVGSTPCALRAGDEVFYVGRAVERVAD